MSDMQITPSRQDRRAARKSERQRKADEFDAQVAARNVESDARRAVRMAKVSPGRAMKSPAPPATRQHRALRPEPGQQGISCPKCGGQQFKARRTKAARVGMVATGLIGAAVTRQKLVQCVTCGNIYDRG